MTGPRTSPGIAAGSRVLVTGAAGGFGAPTVARLLERGVHVVGLDRRHPATERTPR